MKDNKQKPITNAEQMASMAAAGRKRTKKG